MCVLCAGRAQPAPSLAAAALLALFLDRYLLAPLAMFVAAMSALDHKRYTVAAVPAVVVVVWHLQ